MSKLMKALEKAKHTREQSLLMPFQKQPLSTTQRDFTTDLTIYHDLEHENLKIVSESKERHPVLTKTKTATLNAHLLEQHRVISHFRSPLARDAYNMLRTQLLQKTRENGWNTLMVTSAGPGEGKTLTALNLAMCMARDFLQTSLLVDTNFRNPSLVKYLGLDEGLPGLYEYLSEERDLSDLLINPGLDKMVILPAGNVNSGSTELLGSPKLRHLAHELKHRYPDRYVIFDCPHILDMPDSLVFSTFVDGVIMVVARGRTSRTDVKAAQDFLQDRNIVGFVLNQLSKK